MQNSYLTAAEKTKLESQGPVKGMMKLFYIPENVNVNFLINFILFVMQRQVSVGKQNSIVKLKFVQIVVIFLNDLDKEMRRQKAKSQGYSLQIPCGIRSVMRQIV